LSLVVLNRFPYNNGHLLISPRAHKATLEDLTPEELLDGLETVRQMIRCIDAIMKPDGYNVGLNLGRAAGAGLPGHLHWHIVPRWNGDTNFMTTVGEERVIVQSLDAFWHLLRAEIARWG
jgi:ATP adenylyltransferase